MNLILADSLIPAWCVPCSKIAYTLEHMIKGGIPCFKQSSAIDFRCTNNIDNMKIVSTHKFPTNRRDEYHLDLINRVHHMKQKGARMNIREATLTDDVLRLLIAFSRGSGLYLPRWAWTGAIYGVPLVSVQQDPVLGRSIDLGAWWISKSQ